MDEQGAESSKIDATQACIRRLLTKLNVCIKAIDAISSRIHKLRDEELQPQIGELIHGYGSALSCLFMYLLHSYLMELDSSLPLLALFFFFSSQFHLECITFALMITGNAIMVHFPKEFNTNIHRSFTL